MRAIMNPNSNMPPPIMGIIQWILGTADQPHQNNPMGMKNEPKIKEGILISGLPFPLFLSANMAYIFLETYPENTTPIKDPIPGPNRLNPTAPCEKWYTSENRVESVTNMSRKMPYIKARYRLKVKQIKLRVSKIMGRLRFSHSMCHIDSFVGVGIRATAAFSRCEAFFANLERITGEYVSLKHSMPNRLATPHEMTIAMKIYLMPMLSVIMPPITGPAAAATRGIKTNIAMATAFSRSEKRSSMTPPATAIGQAEATPTKKRNAIKDPAFGT
jgi:hypothetical protein